MSAEQAPLKGLTFLNLRAVEDARALTAPLVALGAKVIEWPAIAFVPPSDGWKAFDVRARSFQAGDWIAFTSPNALRWTIRRLRESDQDKVILRAARLAAIGRGTARELADAGLRVSVMPTKQFQAEGLRDAMLAALVPAEPVWLPRAEEAREILVTGLEEAGHRVCVTPVYRTAVAENTLAAAHRALEHDGVDWVVFTSSAIVTHFLKGLPAAGRERLGNVQVACLGRITAEAAQAGGLRVAALPNQQDIPSLVDTILAEHSGRGSRKVGD